MNDALIPGRTVRDIVESNGVPEAFVPRPMEPNARSRLPFERPICFHDPDETTAPAKSSRAERA